MIQTILAIVIIVAAVGFAYWYMQENAKKREKEDQEIAEQEARESALQSGLPLDVRPLCPDDPRFQGNGDCLIRDILDDGVAHNSKWVDPEFTERFWEVFDRTGGNQAEALRAAMFSRRWKSGSQGQVFDRMQSHGLISEATKERWKAQAEQKFPSGYGVA